MERLEIHRVKVGLCNNCGNYFVLIPALDRIYLRWK